MPQPFLASITMLSGGGGAQPKSTGQTLLAMIIPLGGGEHVDAGGPGWQGGIPDPGYGIEGGGGEHPWWGGGGRPRPGHDLPGGGGHPSGGFPVNPDRPDNSLPPGGTQVPPEISNALPPPGGDLATQVVVAIYVPEKGWTAKSFPMPQPKPA